MAGRALSGANVRIGEPLGFAAIASPVEGHLCEESHRSAPLDYFHVIVRRYACFIQRLPSAAQSPNSQHSSSQAVVSVASGIETGSELQSSRLWTLVTATTLG